MKLYLFELGRFTLPDLPAGIPVPGYLIQTDEGRNILVDTGLPASYIDEPPVWPGGGTRMTAADDVVHRLAGLGLTPADIDQVLVTHFDIDHIGNLSCFAHAEVVVQRRQLEVAQAGHPRFVMTQPQWANPAVRYRLLDGDTVLAPGVEVVESSGHVPGHQSVLVRLPETGPVLLAIDAITHSSLTDPDTRQINAVDDDGPDTRTSTRKLMALVEQAGVPLVVFGHDTDQWATLRHAPAFYN